MHYQVHIELGHQCLNSGVILDLKFSYVFLGRGINKHGEIVSLLPCVTVSQDTGKVSISVLFETESKFFQYFAGLILLFSYHNIEHAFNLLHHPEKVI